jgi:biotin--protein ligase
VTIKHAYIAGMGINLSNSSPTTCINDIITDYNERTKSKLRKLTYEEFLARVFSEIENLLHIVQNGNINHMYDQYYKNWMHT